MDENICPICQRLNNCMAYSGKACWCNSIKVPQKLLDLIPDNQKGESCICRACIEKFNAQQAINNN